MCETEFLRKRLRGQKDFIKFCFPLEKAPTNGFAGAERDPADIN